MTIELQQFHPANDRRALGRFVSLPFKLFGDNPKWVPPLKLQVREDLNTHKNPFYRHADIVLWNAVQNGEYVGRIAAVHDERHNEFHKENTGFFGFFECIDDQGVANALFDAATDWLRERGLDKVRGPANPSFNHTVGLQVSAYDHKPYIMMAQNPAYYERLVENHGFGKAKDLLAYEMTVYHEFPPRMTKLADRLVKKNQVTCRYIDMKRFNEELKLIRDLYNASWEKNWGFVPMDDTEFDHMAKSLKSMIWKELCIIAEKEGEAIGFILCLPDINEILVRNRNGRLFPFGLFRLLFGLRSSIGALTRTRVVTLGVKSKFRRTGVMNLLCLEAHRSSLKLGLKFGELSWVLEDNKDMVNIAELTCKGGPYKRYRVFDKALPPA